MASTCTLRVAVVAQAPASGVKVRIWAPGPAVEGLNVLLVTPGPIQLPPMPFWLVVGRLTGEAAWQKGPIAAKVGVTAALTVTLRVAVVAQAPPLGVNVRIWAPAPAVAGLKVLLVTPGPDQEPLIPFWLVAGRATGEADWQKGPIGAKVGVVAVLTVTLRVAVVAQPPALGVKVRVCVPAPAVDGLKVLLVTPGPDQLPLTPFWLVVGRATGEAVWQKGPIEAKVGVVAGLTVTVVLAVPAQSAGFAVKVRFQVPSPAAAGLKVVPDTPGPDQVPETPPGLELRVIGASDSQKGPRAGKVGESSMQVMVMLEKMIVSLVAQV